MIALLVALALAAGYPPPSSQGLRPAKGYSWLCEGSDSVCPGHVPKSLRRPLHFPTNCTVSERHSISPRYGPGLGPGPAYPVGFDADVTLHVLFGDLLPPPWLGQKVLWTVAPSYRGPVLIRGHEIAGQWWMGFEGSKWPLQELQLPPVPRGQSTRWRDFPSYTRVREAGCYSYQVDGTTFSRVVVFRAVVGY